MDEKSDKISYLLTVPGIALNYSNRLKLSLLLDIKQPLPAKNGLTRDYRGLAELMDFQYTEIQSFERSDSPTMKILNSWQMQQNATIGQLVQYLEKMERYDIIEDLLEKFEADAEMFSRKQKQQQEIAPQVTEVSTAFSQPVLRNENDLAVLTRDDMTSGECTYYDAYVSYADQDLYFVWELAKHLESSDVGLKLCIPGRDVLAGHSKYDTNAKLIQERCRRMLVILSPDFLKSPACEFQTSFATGLAIEQRKRIMIPVILSPCEIPMTLKFLSKIDFTRPGIQDWVWGNLVSSLRDTGEMPFRSSAERSVPQIPQLKSSPPDVSNPCITYPPSLNHVPASDHYLTAGVPLSSCTSTTVDCTDGATNTTWFSNKVDPKKKSRKLKWSSPWKSRTSSSNYSDVSASSSSSATSGFHSESGNNFESMDVAQHVSTNNTAV